MHFPFPRIKDIKKIDFSVSYQTVSTVSQPVPIFVIPPQSFVFQAGSSSVPLSNSNMAIPTFLLNIYAPLNLPQPLNVMPQYYLKLLPNFIGEDEATT